MKSIIYLSDYGDRPCKPVFVNHDPRFPAYEHYKHHDPRYTGKHYSLKYVCTVESGMGIHEKINRRAEHISKTASIRILHGRVAPPHWDDKRPVGRDYQWYVTPERIARSRFRHWKRRERTRSPGCWIRNGYSCIEWSFGIQSFRDALNHHEREAIAARLTLASTSRAPLPPWSLNSAVDEMLGKQAA